MNAKERIVELIEKKRETFITAADTIWGTPETRFATKESVKPYYEILEKEGFTLEKGLANMEHAFVATFGSGTPVIGILAEYDALDNLSQVADAAKQEALEIGGPGHGCGHNLLGTGSLAAAVGLKDLMVEENLPGTIKLFGCPAEESGYGKAFMARDGIFDDVDVALSWHPMDLNRVWSDSSLAVYQIYYTFTGNAAHAAAAPEKGRSALDAAELMNIGTQFLREHMIDEARVHYAFMDVGGQAANVVQPTAKLYYFIRAPRQAQARDILARVNKIAEGAALMTETELEITLDSACAEYMPNKVATTAMYENLKQYGRIDLSPEDIAYEQRFYDGLPDTVKESLYSRAAETFPDASQAEIENYATAPLLEAISPLVFADTAVGSTDVGDVSWVTPTAQVLIACEPQGTPPHSWQWVANGKSDVAHKGLLSAGKVIATTAYDFLTQPDLLAEVQAEFANMVENTPFVSGIPADVLPK
jgi:aminobenzoyl-glutamate utilization protein B